MSMEFSGGEEESSPSPMSHQDVASGVAMSSMLLPEEGQTTLAKGDSDPFVNEDNDEATRRRFQIELEFVQSLANPSYLNYLAQRGYFKQPSFLNYLKYLMYWKEPEYCRHLVYPQCLRLLEMLQQEKFLQELVNAQCTRFIDDQLIRVWLNYKKKHDWVKFDPTRIPDTVQKLIKPEDRKADDQMVALAEEQDPFSALTFIKNEKF